MREKTNKSYNTQHKKKYKERDRRVVQVIKQKKTGRSGPHDYLGSAWSLIGIQYVQLEKLH